MEVSDAQVARRTRQAHDEVSWALLDWGSTDRLLAALLIIEATAKTHLCYI
ncbi:MAG: hypothetical protein ACRDWA_17300 [Acidimicrobiia bacterium]